MKINNLPNYAKDHRFIVYRVVNGEAWFWGAYDEVSEASNAMMDIDGCIVETEKVDFA